MTPRAADPFGRGLVAMAHRGGAGEAAENSPSAFQHAVDLGFRWIETDVRSTRDGHALIFHDATLDRTTDDRGPVAARTRSELAGVRLADGHPPMTLAEALRRWPTTAFNVDVKSADAIGPFLRAVAEADAWHRVCAASFSLRRLARVRSLAGGRLATTLSSPEAAALVLGRGPGGWACAVQVPPSVSRFAVVTPRLVERAHRLGLAVHVWTVDDRTEMQRLLDLGVDGLITDRPSLLVELMREREQWPPPAPAGLS